MWKEIKEMAKAALIIYLGCMFLFILFFAVAGTLGFIGWILGWILSL